MTNQKKKESVANQNKSAANKKSRKTKKIPGVNEIFSEDPVKTMESIMTKNKTQFDEFTKEATEANQEQLEALTKSGNIFTKGCEDLMKTYMSLAQTSAERNTEAFKALLGSKSLNEFSEKQNKLVQENADEFLSSVTTLSEISVKVSTEAWTPLNDQINKSVKKASESVAA